MTVYFIDNNRGNDSNNGLTKGTAWKTLEKFRSVAATGGIAPGSDVLLESSSIFNENRYLRFGTGTSELLNGTVNARTTIGKYDYSSQYSGLPRVSWVITPQSSDWVFDPSFGLWYLPRTIQYSNNNQQWGGHPRVTINGRLCSIVRYQSGSFTRGNPPTEDYEVFVYEASQPGRLYLYSPTNINPSDYYGAESIKASPTQFGIFAFIRCGSYVTIKEIELYESGKLVSLYSDTTSIGDTVGFCLQNTVGTKIGVLADFTSINSGKLIRDLNVTNNQLVDVTGLGLHLSGYFNNALVSSNIHIGGNLGRTDGGAVYIQGGVDGVMSNVVISDNYYERMNANVKGSESDGCAVYCEIRSNGVLITRNIVKDSYMAFQDNSGRNNTWVSNVALNCDSFMKVTDADNLAVPGQRTRILNNTALLRGNYWQSYSTRDYGMRLMNGPGVATSSYTFEVKNNVLVLDKTDSPRPNTTAIADVSGATLDQSNNAIYGWDNTRTRVGLLTELGLPGVLRDNPLLASTGELKSVSPLIGAGTNLGIYQDYNGNSFKRKPSIGAFEYYKRKTRNRTGGF